jgi:ankyrin repeat protein
VIHELLRAGKATDGEGTYLHKCAEDGGSYELSVELMNVGISANVQDIEGNTPLHAAAKAGNLAVARALCERGADLGARNKHNRTPKMVVRVALLQDLLQKRYQICMFFDAGTRTLFTCQTCFCTRTVAVPFV